MTHKTEMKRNSNKGRLRMVALSETFPAIIVWPATPELVQLDHVTGNNSAVILKKGDCGSDLILDCQKHWCNLALLWVLHGEEGGLFQVRYWGNTQIQIVQYAPKTYTNNTKSHTPNTVSVPHPLSTALINTSMKYMFIQQMGEI